MPPQNCNNAQNIIVRSGQSTNERSFLEAVDRRNWNAADIYISGIESERKLDGVIPHKSVLINLFDSKLWCEEYPSLSPVLTRADQFAGWHPLARITNYAVRLRLLGVDPTVPDEYGDTALGKAQNLKVECPHNKKYMKEAIKFLNIPVEQLPGLTNDTISQDCSAAPSLHANYLLRLTGIVPVVTTILQLGNMAASAGVRLITGAAFSDENVTQLSYQPNTISNSEAGDTDHWHSFAALGTLCGLGLGAYLFSTIKAHSGSISSFFKKNNPSYQAESFTKKLN